MKSLLRVVAIFVGLAVILTVLQVARFTFNGDIAVLVRSGALGVATIAAWFVILTAGPIVGSTDETSAQWPLRGCGTIRAFPHILRRGALPS